MAHFDKVIDINQSPIGRTPRSNPATYTGLFTPIRELFAGTQEARARGYTVGRFSFNVRGGQIIAEGTPEEVAKDKKSHTARFLKEILKKG
ncbi:branched-chain amino acid ATP-binding cassette transporter family protein [Glaesserella parasuis 12939]|nr:hypothetical protein A4U84_01405 [Glaesserella parasuis]EQA04370.1 branched-chain amino acid ATP-binding cassette transporter family protein [Glaesserella parasuis MN-H]EQA06043.1 branched-chain amino acid ATP-binding cassette transporter family protein [Glaesserella parasuis 12939]EQA13634.1 branched-chain amino acid ATP-binding cassette transporter family protein [Glaesserella parasuis SW140]